MRPIFRAAFALAVVFGTVAAPAQTTVVVRGRVTASDDDALAPGIQRGMERFHHLKLCGSLAIIGRL